MKTQLNHEVSQIPHTGLRILTENVLAACPDCFWRMPASTTGRYHPQISLGEGGLIRHTRAVVRFALHLLDFAGVDSNHPAYSIALAACILHDCCKKRDDERYTAFDHPLRAAALIEQEAAKLDPGSVEPDLLRRLLECVKSHMGRWNTDPKYHPGIILPKPEKALPRLVSLADYLASRKDLTLSGIA